MAMVSICPIRRTLFVERVHSVLLPRDFRTFRSPAYPARVPFKFGDRDITCWKGQLGKLLKRSREKRGEVGFAIGTNTSLAVNIYW